MKNWKTITLAAAVIVLIIGFQNMGKVPVQILFWSPFVPKIVLLLGALIIGFVAGFFTRRKRG
jgi:uncharacterized integral membrane protein